MFTIRLPPLRERRADILPLADACLRDIGRAMRQPEVPLTPEGPPRRFCPIPGQATCVNCATPSNGRRSSLKTVRITAAEHRLPRHVTSPQFDQAEVNLDALQRRTIARVLDQVRGNKSQAAKRLGLTRMIAL